MFDFSEVDIYCEQDPIPLVDRIIQWYNLILYT